MTKCQELQLAELVTKEETSCLLYMPFSTSTARKRPLEADRNLWGSWLRNFRSLWNLDVCMCLYCHEWDLWLANLNSVVWANHEINYMQRLSFHPAFRYDVHPVISILYPQAPPQGPWSRALFHSCHFLWNTQVLTEDRGVSSPTGRLKEGLKWAFGGRQ